MRNEIMFRSLVFTSLTFHSLVVLLVPSSFVDVLNDVVETEWGETYHVYVFLLVLMALRWNLAPLLPVSLFCCLVMVMLSRWDEIRSNETRLIACSFSPVDASDVRTDARKMRLRVIFLWCWFCRDEMRWGACIFLPRVHRRVMAPEMD